MDSHASDVGSRHADWPLVIVAASWEDATSAKGQSGTVREWSRTSSMTVVKDCEKCFNKSRANSHSFVSLLSVTKFKAFDKNDEYINCDYIEIIE